MSRPLLPFKYYGGKSRLVGWLAERMPDGDHFVDLFCGSAVVALNLPHKIKTINDINSRLVNFFRVLRDSPDELQRLCLHTLHSRAEWEASREVSPDPVEDARRFFVLATQTVNGRADHPNGGWDIGHKGSAGNRAAMSRRKAEQLLTVAAALRDAQIENKPAVELARQVGKHRGTVLYADPPYIPATRRKAAGVYSDEMTEADHRKLAETLNRLPCAAAVSGYRSELYDELYSGWVRHEREVAVSARSRNGGNARAVECLWVKR